MQHAIVCDLVASTHTVANALPIEPRDGRLGGIDQRTELSAATDKCSLVPQFREHLAKYIEGQEKRQGYRQRRPEPAR